MNVDYSLFTLGSNGLALFVVDGAFRSAQIHLILVTYFQVMVNITALQNVKSEMIISFCLLSCA